MRISDWSSDVCSSDLQEALRARLLPGRRTVVGRIEQARLALQPSPEPAVAVVDDDDQGERAGVLEVFVGETTQPDLVLRVVSHQQVAGIEHKNHADSSEERRVGKECVSMLRHRWSLYL